MLAVSGSKATAQGSEAPVPAEHVRASATASPDAVPAGKPYFIEFRSRSAYSYGHTFAVVGRVGQKLTKANVVGLHPATDSSVPWMIGHVVAVPSETGWSDGDIEDKYITARYRILLSAAEYKNLSAYIAKLKASSPQWHAVLYNCNAFVASIAENMGLRTPSSTLLMPKEFITELRQLNAAKSGRQAGVSPGSRTIQ